jgi:hypothetical protein
MIRLLGASGRLLVCLVLSLSKGPSAREMAG